MSKDLIERLRIFTADPVLGGVIEGSVERIEELEKERDQLREQVEILRTNSKTAADYLDQTATCNSDKAISSQFRKILAATEPKQ